MAVTPVHTESISDQTIDLDIVKYTHQLCFDFKSHTPTSVPTNFIFIFLINGGNRINFIFKGYILSEVTYQNLGCIYRPVSGRLNEL